MVTKIFINLPVKDLKKSMDFFTSLGFTFNQQFTDEKAACLVMSEHIFAMLLTEPFFKTFTKKAVADAHKTTEVMLAIDSESKEAVDLMVKTRLRPVEQSIWNHKIMAGCINTVLLT